MKNPRVLLCITALVLAVFAPASAPRARADDVTDRQATADLLTAGAWKVIYEKGWFVVRFFDKNGAFASPGRPDESGRWKIVGATLVQTFADGRKDIFNLPLKPAGTSGTGKDGENLNAVQDSNISAPFPTPAPALDADAKNEIAATLVSAPWKFSAGTWSVVRICNKDTTFTTDGGDERGHWKIADGMIALIFADGHKDFFILPLDPKGTAAALETGEAATATQVAAASTPTPAPAPLLSPSLIESNHIPSPTPTPLDENAREANAALLVSGPWKITGGGGGWMQVRVFNKNGTFTTLESADSHGRWKMSGTAITLLFADGHKDTISVPLDPKGTPGTDMNGAATTAMLLSAGEAAKLAPRATTRHAHSVREAHLRLGRLGGKYRRDPRPARLRPVENRRERLERNPRL